MTKVIVLAVRLAASSAQLTGAPGHHARWHDLTAYEETAAAVNSASSWRTR